MTAQGTLSLAFEFPHHSPFFHLDDSERIDVEHALIRQMLAHFPIDVQKRWGGMQFNVAPDHCVENEIRVRELAESRLGDLMGASFSLASMTPSEWVCRIVLGRHVCERIYPLLENGSPWIVQQPSSRGLVYAPVTLMLAWESRLPQPSPQD
jgi:hypothetical protein